VDKTAHILPKTFLGRGYTVYGTYRRTSSVNFWRIDELGITNHPGLKLVEYDLTDMGSAIRLIETSEATEIYNLAAQSFVGVSFDQPITTGHITLGAAYLLEAIRTVNRDIRFYQASTSEMFGKVQAIPQTESTPFTRAAPMVWPSFMRIGLLSTIARASGFSVRAAFSSITSPPARPRVRNA
jgi:GDPmannose 4,6-dehydratase